jgi:hypothetical protein
MIGHQPALRYVAASMAALLFVLPRGADAEAYISATAGSGPNAYRSTEVSGDADLFDTPLRVNAFGFKSSSSAAVDVSQSGFGLDWKTSKLATLGVKHNKVDNGSVDIGGNALNLALSLNTLWKSDLLTRVDFKLDGSAYRFKDLPPAVKNDTINQSANSINLTQDFTEWFSLYGGHDRYSYDRDPVNAAVVLMLKAPRRFINASTNLLSFPDSTNRFGLTLRPQEALTLDLSSSKTVTLLDQQLKTKRLGLDFQVTDHMNIYAGLSKATSTAVVTKRAYIGRTSAGAIVILAPAGTVLMPATNDTYTEFSLGWTF